MNIVMAENFRAVFYAPFYATLALGHFQQQGLDVALVESASPGMGIADMVAGRTHLVWGGPLRVIKERETNPISDQSLVAFCEVAAKDPFFLVASPHNPLAQANGFSWPLLAQQRLATVTEVPTPWLCLQQDARDAGMDPANLQRVDSGSMADNLAALSRQQLDVVQLFEPYVSQALANGTGSVVHAAHTRGWTAYTTFITTQHNLRVHQQALLAMVTAIELFPAWLAQHGTRALAKAVQPYYPQLPFDVLQASMQRYADAQLWTCRRSISRAGFARLASSMVSGGFVQHAASYEDCVAPMAHERTA